MVWVGIGSGIPEQQCTMKVREECLSTWVAVIFLAMFPHLSLTVSLKSAGSLGKHFKV